MITYLRGRQDVDSSRIVLLGWGLGAGIAIEAAARDTEVAAVCCANGAGHYRGLHRLPPRNSIGKIAPRPVLILHGEDNLFMPLDEAYSLYRAAGEPKKLHVVPNADHLSMIALDQPSHGEVITILLKWLRCR